MMRVGAMSVFQRSWYSIELSNSASSAYFWVVHAFPNAPAIQLELHPACLSDLLWRNWENHEIIPVTPFGKIFKYRPDLSRAGGDDQFCIYSADGVVHDASAEQYFFAESSS